LHQALSLLRPTLGLSEPQFGFHLYAENILADANVVNGLKVVRLLI
jgi:hypothetical protein